MELKNSASKKKDQVWQYRDNVDLYTEMDREAMEYQYMPNQIETDHILEIQLLNKVWLETQYALIRDGAPSQNTRLTHQQLQKVNLT